MPAKKKRTAKTKAVVSYEEKLAALAARESERNPGGGGGDTISLNNKVFSFHGEELGRELSVVVLEYAFVNLYYDRPYDEDNPSPPACFALAAETADGMAPHPTSPVPQGDDDGECAGCWANQYGSDSRGRGKACKNTRRLAVISADELDRVQDTEDPPVVAYIRVPPSSLAAWRGYTNKLAMAAKKPPLAFVTTMSFDPDVRHPKLEFRMERPIENDLLPNLMALRETILDELLSPPDVTDYESPPEPKTRKKRATKKKVTRKKKTTGSGSRFG